MSFFKRLASLLSPTRGSDKFAYWVTVECNRCGEKIRARIDTRNDLSINYDEEGGGTTYYCRKVLIGDQLCFQQVEVELTFDQNRKLVDRQITGGKFVDEA